MRSRPKFTTKIYLRTNAKVDPLTFDVAGGEAHEFKGYVTLMENDSDAIHGDFARRAIEPVIPPRSNRKTPIRYDREAHKRRIDNGLAKCCYHGGLVPHAAKH